MEEGERKHWVSVAAAIVRANGSVLAIRRRDTNKWEPPGGTLEPNETVLDGLRREVLEETGMVVDPGPLTGVYKNMRRGIVALVFRCNDPGGEPRLTAESIDARWLTRQEIEKNLDPAYACRLLDALKLDQVAIRTHDGERLFSP